MNGSQLQPSSSACMPTISWEIREYYTLCRRMPAPVFNCTLRHLVVNFTLTRYKTLPKMCLWISCVDNPVYCCVAPRPALPAFKHFCRNFSDTQTKKLKKERGTICRVRKQRAGEQLQLSHLQFCEYSVTLRWWCVWFLALGQEHTDIHTTNCTVI